MNKSLSLSLALAVHDAINSPGQPYRAPVSGPTFSNGEIVGFAHGFLTIGDNETRLEFTLVTINDPPPTKPRGAPHRDALRVARVMALLILTGYYGMSMSDARSEIVRILKPLNERDIRRLLKDERTGQLLGYGLQIIGEAWTPDDPAKTPMAMWFDKQSSIKQNGLELEITGPSWYWCKGMPEAVFASRRFKLTASTENELQSISNMLRSWRTVGGNASNLAPGG